MTAFARAKLLVAGIALLAALWCLEAARSSLTSASFKVGSTPVTSWQRVGATGPVVVMAHGFAGSSQMMQGYALPLARAGYRVVLFDFLGHRRNPLPMSGDVTSIDGTTRLLMDQTSAVIEAVRDENAPVALVGHSMATDVLVRVAAERQDVGPLVLISAFSRAIDAQMPRDLLFVTGAWEPGLRAFATEALQMVDPFATEGASVEVGGVRRAAVIAPRADHVSVLHSPTGRQVALDWLDEAFDRSSEVTIYPTGPAIVGLIAGVVILLVGAARLLPWRDVQRASLSRAQLSVLLLAPMVTAPLVSWWLDPQVLPVLVADYLALHLAIYGGVQLGLLALFRVPMGGFSAPAFLFLLVACSLIAIALDRYAANFLPTSQRLWIVAVMAVGAVAFFLADARLCHAQSLRLRALVHGVFLLSLVIAVALDLEGLFFLAMIAPVIVLFYFVFGSLGHAVSTRSGPVASGLALGLVLAVALGVSFPLFSS